MRNVNEKPVVLHIQHLEQNTKSGCETICFPS